jgi:predicted TIM-barrel fold metal-dependent hydrolase
MVIILKTVSILLSSSLAHYFSSNSFLVAAMASPSRKTIDAHLHVWGNADDNAGELPYAPGKDPPISLANVADTESLLKVMDKSGIDGALIIQPINYEFDHSYVLNAVHEHPDRFKCMMLHDPSLGKEAALSRLEEMHSKGVVGVRFNPYLWPKADEGSWTPISSTEAGVAVYKRCGELKMPVGIMCFQGLHLHFQDILELLRVSPSTTLILDHFAFTSFEDEERDMSFRTQLLELAKFPQVYVKISALFRLADPTSDYQKVRTERFEPLLQTFGAERLLFGSDFPFVLEQAESYKGTVDLVDSWIPDESTRNEVMGGTAERLFGPWRE